MFFNAQNSWDTAKRNVMITKWQAMFLAKVCGYEPTDLFPPSTTSRDRKYSLDLQYVQLLNMDLYIMENTQYTQLL